MRYAILFLCFLIAGSAEAATYFVDITLGANCATGNYSRANRNCTGSDGSAYNTIQAAVNLLQPGDTIYFRGGTYPSDQRIDLMTPNISGTAAAWITIAGYPGERPTLRWFDPSADNQTGYGPIKAWGNRGYFVFQNLTLDGSLNHQDTRWQVRGGNHHLIIRDVEMHSFWGSPILIKDNSHNITVQDCNLHDQQDGGSASRHYGIYVGSGDQILIERNQIHHNPGGGIIVYKGTLTNLIIRNNSVHDNTTVNFQVAGIDIYSEPTGGITNAQVYGNLVYKNGLLSAHATPSGIRVSNGVSGAKIWNNTIYNNKGYGINIQVGSTGGGPPTGTVTQNNIITGNTIDAIVDAGTGTTKTFNACLSAESCGTTKITLSSATACFANAATDDYRLKNGTNACRDTGTEVAAISNYVALPDLGAYEQGKLAYATVNGGFVDVSIDIANPGILPANGITGITVACVGCAGTPIVTAAIVKPSATNVVQLSLAGITSNGTCSITITTSNNMTDSLMIGGTAQGVNSSSAYTTSGSCRNTDSTPVPGGLWSHFALNEGSGTVASDDTGNNHHGTVSAGVAWVNDESGTGITIPADTTYRHITSTYGSGVNSSSASFAMCVYGKPTLSGNPQKVVFSSGTNGTNQRWYAGWATVGGQLQWGIGVQGSGFLTGSEFVVQERMTFVCAVNDSATDTTTLWVDGVKGTVVGKSVKSLTSYVLTNNLIVGNDGTNSGNNGGFTAYEVWIWDSKPSDTTLTDLYAGLSPVQVIAGLAQTQLQWERVHTDTAMAPMILTPLPDGSINVVADGAVAFRVQYDCTGVNCAGFPPRLYYSLNGTDFPLPVPETLGVNEIYMWGDALDQYLNTGISSGCLNAAGLTAHSGVTNLHSLGGPLVTLAQNHCRSDRYIVRFGAVPNTSYWFRVKSESGEEFGNGYPKIIKVNVIDPQACGGS